MNIEDTEIIIGLVFGLFGFIIAFFVRRSINIIIFTAFTYAAFKALDGLDFETDWALFNNFTYTLSDLGKAALAIVSGMLGNASVLSLVSFIVGGVTGLFAKKRGA